MKIPPKTVQVVPKEQVTTLVKTLQEKSPFCFRYSLEDEDLRASIQRSGILMPLVVVQTKQPVVIAGHKRLFAARSLKLKEVPAVILETIEPREAFLLSLVSNWKQVFSEMDRVRALGMAAGEFHFKENEILSIVMPLLGLSGDRTTLELYRQSEALSPLFQDLIEVGRWPLRSVSSFLKFSKSDQEYFAREVGAKIKLTSSQLLQAGEWLLDLMKGTGRSLAELCRAQGLLSKMNRHGMDPRTKADLFFSRVRKLRFPEYARYLEIFGDRRVDILRGVQEFRLEPVQGFEEPGFELCARVRDPAALERLVEKLALKRTLLHSLFEIAL